MANNTFVGFPHGQGDTGIDAADVVKEMQPVTTWNRDGGYTVTRRWRGPIDALVNFSDGGASNADFDGTYFNGTTGILLGGPGRDGAISTNLQRDEGGQLGIFSATWVTSNIASALGNPRAAGRTGTSGDQYQESSQWTLDGNDLEKDVYRGMVLEACEAALKADTAGTQFGFTTRVRTAIDRYKNAKDDDGNGVPDYFDKEFDIEDYFGATADHPLSVIIAEASVLGNSNLLDDLKEACSDILRGQDAFSISQYVLRNTKTVPYTSSLIPHYANVNRIWTTANITTLMAAETRAIDPPTSAVAYTIPLLGVLGTIFSSSVWLYRTPDVQQMNNGKWQVTKEWWEGAEIAESSYKNYGVA